MQFSSLHIIDPILRALQEEGYSHPTPIQAEAIPLVLKGGDLLGCAQTGTGKTAAFAIPILQRLLENNSRRPVKKSVHSLSHPPGSLPFRLEKAFRLMDATLVLPTR